MKKSLSIISVFSVFLIMLFVTGCQKTATSAPNMSLQGAVITSGNNSVTLDQNQMNNSQPILNSTSNSGSDANSGSDTSSGSTNNVDYGNVSYTLTATEGDLVALKPKAISPDGLPITYAYSFPFNSDGLWQTNDGDAGKYLVTVTATAGGLNTTADILVVIKPSNKAPMIDCPADINVKEGDNIDLGCHFFDKENDPLVIEYSGWMTSPTYTTNYDSSGNHKVFVAVSDGFHNVSKTVNVHVENVDRAPIFNIHLKDMTVTETDVVTLNTNVTDPDSGDKITLTYSEPFNNKGVWKTVLGDAGTYPVSVVASDGTLNTKESFTLTVKMLNTAPVMQTIKNITVDEGSVVAIHPVVTDREGDPIIITYSGWMKSDIYTTTFDDAYPNGCGFSGCGATYKVTVTASDGTFSVSQDVYVSVLDKNRPPVFVWPSH